MNVSELKRVSPPKRPSTTTSQTQTDFVARQVARDETTNTDLEPAFPPSTPKEEPQEEVDSALSAAESLELLLESLEDVLEPWKLYPASVNTLLSPCLSCEANDDWLDVEIFAATQDLPRMRRRKILESLPLKPGLLLPASHARPPKTGSK